MGDSYAAPKETMSMLVDIFSTLLDKVPSNSRVRKSENLLICKS